MPSLFSITAPTATVHLDKNRQVEVTFTVYNTSGRRVRGRALISSEDASANASYVLGQEIERDFAVKGAHQYKVQISVPADTPVGTYSFQMNMLDVENPNDPLARGQTVAFEVVEPDPPSPFPWKIPVIVIAAILVVVIGVVVYLLLRPPGTIEVPDVRDLTVAEATERLTDAGLEVDPTTVDMPDGVIPEGLLINTDPPSGASLEKGSIVTLIVSMGIPPGPTNEPNIFELSIDISPLSAAVAGVTVTGEGEHEEQTRVDVEASPAETDCIRGARYVFDHWENVSGTPSRAQTFVVMDEDKSIEVVYREDEESCLPEPVAGFDVDKTEGEVPLEVRFLNRSGGNPGSFLWNFGDGNSSTEEDPVHVYTEPGTYSVILTVENARDSDFELKSNLILAKQAPVSRVSISWNIRGPGGPVVLGAFEPGDSGELIATLRDSRNNLLTGRQIEWSVSNNGIVRVSPTTGTTVKVTALKEGSATVTAESEGRRGSFVVTVRRDVLQISP